MTKVLLNLTCFFGCAFLGASMVLFTGWPLALVSAGLVFLGIQQVNAALVRRKDKRAYAKEFSKLHSAAMEFQTQLNDTRDRIAALDLAMEERSNAQGRKIVAELKVLESLMREFAGKISRSATPVEVPRIPSTGPAGSSSFPPRPAGGVGGRTSGLRGRGPLRTAAGRTRPAAGSRPESRRCRAGSPTAVSRWSRYCGRCRRAYAGRGRSESRSP